MVTSIPAGITVFIVDTEQYAGSFAGNMCAYMTGRVGELGVGENYAELYSNETELDPLSEVADVADEKGVMRPWDIWPTHGWFNNGTGNYYLMGQEARALTEYRQQAARERALLCKQRLLVLSEIMEGRTVDGPTVKSREAEIQKHKHEIKDIQLVLEAPFCPAYLSAAIFFFNVPDEKLMRFLKERAFRFVDVRKDIEVADRGVIDITGFRMLHIQSFISADAVNK